MCNYGIRKKFSKKVKTTNFIECYRGENCSKRKKSKWKSKKERPLGGRAKRKSKKCKTIENQRKSASEEESKIGGMRKMKTKLIILKKNHQLSGIVKSRQTATS